MCGKILSQAKFNKAKKYLHIKEKKNEYYRIFK